LSYCYFYILVIPIASDRVAQAIKNVLKEPQLTSVWMINQYCHLAQGTSRNENFHHFLSGKKPSFTGVLSYYTLLVTLDTVVALWNLKYVLLQ
jgi:hypothetical protein